MKVFIYLISFYILVLPITGTAADAVCNEDICVTTGEQSDKSQNQEQCSPFCSCVCCLHATSSYFEMQTLPVLPIVYIDQTYTVDIRGYFPYEILNAVWQPPKPDNSFCAAI